jgi:hypothetical protein
MRYSAQAILAFAIAGMPVSEPAAITKITSPVTTEFGTYTPSIVPFTASVPAYTVPANLDGVLYADRFNFSDPVKALLAKNGFAAIPSNANQLTDIYRNSPVPPFVTTDMAFHAFHKVYDYMLRIAEYKQFYGQLDTMLHGMMTGITPLLTTTANDSLKLAITRAAALLDVAHTLLTDTITFVNNPAVRAMVVAETSLVYQHAGFAHSNVVPDLQEDFSQYVPRGHYTIAPRLEHYFRAMMYLGRMNLRLVTAPPTPPDPRIVRIETMQALVVCRLLATSSVGTTADSTLWTDIYDPTSFLVGRSDDLNFRQYKAQLDSRMGPQLLTGDINQFYTKLDAIIFFLRQLPEPQILSGLSNDGSIEQGFRVMGQRFVPDSYILGQMVYPHVGTITNPRLFPRGLDILAVLGSMRARQYLIQLYHESNYANYTKQLDSLTLLFSVFPSSTWAKNVYWSWMYAIAPLLDVPGNGFPSFMTSVAWADKTLTTASGSWVELRHDTILYAKQSYTGTVGICDEPPIPISQGYVEPNPEVFGRLSSMASYMRMGLTKAGMSSLLPMDKLTNLSSFCTALQGIAVTELQGGDVSLKQYADIELAYHTVATIEDFSQYPIPPSSGYVSPSAGDSTMAVIADVHTDPYTQQVLEVGVGRPMRLFVVAPVEGRLQICQGAMFSYYEFTQPMNNRLTDEQWRAMLKAGTATGVPAWDSSFSASKDLTNYLPYAIDPKAVSYGMDNIPTRCLEGDSVIALVQSSVVPSITVSAGGKDQTFTGITNSTNCQGVCTYRVAIPPEALADSTILTITSKFISGDPYSGCSYQVPLSYRKLLIRKGQSAVINSTTTASLSTAPRIRGNRISVPRGSSWRIVDTRGRQIGMITASTNEWTAPQRFASMPLFLVPSGSTKGKIVRFMFGR